MNFASRSISSPKWRSSIRSIFFSNRTLKIIPFEYESWQRDELAPYFKRQPLTPLFERYLHGISREKKRSNNFLVDLNRQLSRATSNT